MTLQPDLWPVVGDFPSMALQKFPASVVPLVRTLSNMRVVMGSSPDWSENFLILHITSCYVIIEVMAKWFRAHYTQEFRFSSAVKRKKGPRPGPNFAA